MVKRSVFSDFLVFFMLGSFSIFTYFVKRKIARQNLEHSLPRNPILPLEPNFSRRKRMLKSTVEFSVTVKGETSGKEYAGLFTAKTALSFRESLRQDETYRVILGVRPSEAGEYAATVAGAISYLAVRLTQSPTWWKETDGGLDLRGDDSVLVATHKACVDAIDEAYKAFRAEGAVALGELRKNEPGTP